jgi:uncharacterized repeat protein (TIGR01451 family)
LFILGKSWLALGIVIAASATMFAPAAAWAQNADLAVSKSGPVSTAPNTDVTYSITVSNAGPFAATNVLLSDTLPPNTTFVSLAQTSGPIFSLTTPAVGGTGAVSAALASFANGASASFDLTLHVSSSAGGATITNIATVTSDSDPNGTNDSASSSLTVTGAPNADLSVAKTGPATLQQGQNAAYTITLNNAGPNPAANVQLSDFLPPNTTFVSLTQTSGPVFSTTTPAVGANGAVTASLASLASGSSATFALVAQVAPATPTSSTITNTATVSSTTPDLNVTNNSSNSSLTVTAAPASMTANAGTTPQSAVVSTAFASALAVTVKDAGNNPVSGVNVTFTAPGSGASGVFSSSTATITVATNASGVASAPFTANATVGGPYAVTAAAAGLTTVNFALTNTAGAASSMTANAGTTPQSAIISTAFANPLAVTVKDAGNNPISGINVTFTAPGSGASGVFSNSTATITVATNASGVASAPFTANATVGGPYTVTAAAAGLTTINFALTNTAGAANSMTANAGTTPQSAVVSTAFANPLAVTIKDAGNNPISGISVTFIAPGSGASGVFSNSTATITVATNVSGIAAAPFTANATAAGPYTVTAAAAGLTTVNFALTNTAVVKSATTTAVVSSLNPSSAGQTVTFTATVTGASPTGSVTFRDGTTTLGTATLSATGKAALSTSALSVGSHAITAVYGGDAGNNAGTSAALTQTVNTPADSLKLRALQVLVTPMVAQVSGQAISNAVDSAIGEGFNEGGTFIAPSGSGVRVNFAADPEAQATDAAPRATDPFSNANESFAGGRGFGSRPPSPSRVDDSFGALAYAGPTKTTPLRVAEARQWLGWADVRGATLDRWGSTAAVPGANVLYGNQVNLLAGLTRKFTPNFLIGVLGGFETFDYRSDALQGRLKGDGWTVGSYLGWMITQNIRFDSGVAYSGIGYNGTAGLAAGSFHGNRWLFTGGLTGTYTGYGIQIEPSARVYALWEHENAYTDTLGTLQTARDFATGRASGGVKLSYPVPWSATTVVAPYVGLFGDYYFNSDNAGAVAAAAAAIPSNIILDGWSARATGGLTTKFGNGAQVAVGAERAGIGGNFGLWTYRARASVPFGAQ